MPGHDNLKHNQPGLYNPKQVQSNYDLLLLLFYCYFIIVVIVISGSNVTSDVEHDEAIFLNRLLRILTGY